MESWLSREISLDGQGRRREGIAFTGAQTAFVVKHQGRISRHAEMILSCVVASR